MREKTHWRLWPLLLWNVANEMDDELPILNTLLTLRLPLKFFFFLDVEILQMAGCPTPPRIPSPNVSGWGRPQRDYLGGREVVATLLSISCLLGVGMRPHIGLKLPHLLLVLLQCLWLLGQLFNGRVLVSVGYHQEMRNEKGSSMKLVISSLSLLSPTSFSSPSPAPAQWTQSSRVGCKDNGLTQTVHPLKVTSL